MPKFYYIFFAFITSCTTNLLYSQLIEIDSNFNIGNYKKVKKIADKVLNSNASKHIKYEAAHYLSETQENLGEYNAYFKTIKKKKKFNADSIYSEILYYSELGSYYHMNLRIDSAVYFSQKSFDLLNKHNIIDSFLNFQVYLNYANIQRNNFKLLERKSKYEQSMDARNIYLEKVMSNAIKIAPSQYLKEKALFKLGCIYHDYLHLYYNGKTSFPKESAEKSDALFEKVKKNSINPTLRIRSSMMLGLNCHYSGNHKKAEAYYAKTEVLFNEKKNAYENLWVTLNSWRGWNHEYWYKKDQDSTHLLTAQDIYKKTVDFWLDYYTKNSDGNLGFNDGYHISPAKKIVLNSHKLYSLTKNKKYINEAFVYAELSKYLTTASEKIELNQLQQSLTNDEAFVHFTFTRRPRTHLAFVITKDHIDFFRIKKNASLAYNRKMESLHAFDNINVFKANNFLFYESYFKEVDSMLTDLSIQNVIVSHSDGCANLNMDLLLSDTLSNSWNELSYLGNKYKFTYALSAGIYLQSIQEKVKSSPTSTGVTAGTYSSFSNLRFSKSLMEKLDDNFNASITDFNSNIHKHDLSIVLAHGFAEYTQKIGEIQITDSVVVNASDISNMKLNNELVLFLGCNTNASQQYFSEGSVGSFAKAFRYAGSKSVITTGWEIDDKSNAEIAEYFLNYLEKGYNKRDALWKAKETFRNSYKDSEMDHPRYWAPYILTGNISGLNLEKQKEINYWLILTSCLIGVLIIFFFIRRIKMKSLNRLDSSRKK